jgi:hypothetical protein
MGLVCTYARQVIIRELNLHVAEDYKLAQRRLSIIY